MKTADSTTSFPINETFIEWYKKEKKNLALPKEIKEREMLSLDKVQLKMKQDITFCAFSTKSVILSFIKNNNNKIITSYDACSTCNKKLQKLYCIKCLKTMYHFKTMYFVKIHLFDLESKLKETVTMFDSLITKMFSLFAVLLNKKLYKFNFNVQFKFTFL